MKSPSAIALLAALLSSAALMAQQPNASQPQQPDTSLSSTPTPAPQPAPQGAARQRMPSPGKQSKKLAKTLNLTRDQQAKIEPILADRDQRIEALRANASLAPRARREQLQAIQQDSKARIEAILTDPQKQLFEQLLADRQANRGKGKGRTPKA